MSVFRRRPADGERRAITSLPFNRSDGSTLNGSLLAPLRLIPLYSATSLITDSVSTCPLHAYDEVGGQRRRSPVQPSLVQDPGVYGLDLVAWLGQATMSLLLRGNAYGVIVALDSRATPSKIKWLNPDAVTVDESGNEAPRYYVGGHKIPDELVVHVAGICPPGSVVALSPLELFRVQIETGLRAGELARKWANDGISPQAILYNKTRPLEPGEGKVVKDRLRASVESGDVLVTGNDWGWLPLSITPSEAQFLEQIQATATEFAAVYKVAPEDIGGKSGQSMTYSTLESNDLRYSRRAVLPWLTRIENAITRLLPEGQYAKFNIDALVRADLKTRMESHAIALDNGLLTQDEARALEDRAPLTPEQIAAWQEQYVVPRPNGAGDTGAARKLAAAEVAQKIYLAAGGQVLTPDEGRQLLVAAGFPLPIPGPDFTKGTQ